MFTYSFDPAVNYHKLLLSRLLQFNCTPSITWSLYPVQRRVALKMFVRYGTAMEQ